MKKILVFILLSFLIVGCQDKETNKEEVKKDPEVQIDEKGDKVVVNLFYWTGCSHCHDEKEWLETLEANNDYLKVNYYEVTEYDELVTSVRNEFLIEGSSVPLTVIGTDYFIGFGNSSKARIMNTIEKYKEVDYCDIVEKIENGEDTLECYDVNNNE